jgi:hypothetical protein
MKAVDEPMKKTHRLAYVVLLCCALLALTACAAGPNDVARPGEGAGFWLGLWQGLISPITFIVSLFTKNVNIYEIHNNGNWYDFGFILGVSVAFSGGGVGGAASRRRRAR